jgi:AcrR family transcriptional regulator
LATRITKGAAKMRKRPRQARSRATVDAILDAGARVLGRSGWAKFTTNEVADTAGVSIGSLYQYFPNKVVLADAIRQRHFDEVLLILKATDDGGKPIGERIERLIAGMIAIHSVNPALHRVLMEEAPASEARRAAHDQFEAEYLRRYEILIGAAGGKRPNPSDRIAAQVLSAAVAGAIHHAAHNGNLLIPDFRQEIVELVRAYLRERRRQPPDGGGDRHVSVASAPAVN